jgi:CheY-like chemotaxis protein
MMHSILVADDSATIRKVIELTFSDTGYRVECVAGGAEALARLAVTSPDLVLADVVMPEPTGYEICRRVKASGRPVPVLLLAGTFETFDHEEARACGADGCLLKPFDSRILLDRVQSLLAQRDRVDCAAVEPCPDGVAAVAGGRAPVPATTEPARVPLADALPTGLSAEAVETLVRLVVARLSEDMVRRVAREVVADVAERIVRERIRELESED